MMVRFVKCSDAQQIEEVMNLCGADMFDSSLNNEEVISKLARKYSELGNVIVLASGVEILGFAAFYNNDFVNYTGFLSLIVVRSIYQCKGFGLRILDSVISNCRDSGMKRLRLEVDKNNLKAQRFYQKNGFNFQSENEVSYFLFKDL